MNALIDLIPAKGRKYLYAVLSGAVAVYGIWQAVEGDWTQFGVSVVTSVTALLATANTYAGAAPVVVLEPVEDDIEFDTETR